MLFIKKHNSQSATKQAYEKTTYNSRNSNEDWNAPMKESQNTPIITTNQDAISCNLNFQPHCLTKTSSKAVEMSRSTHDY